jgi:hypothetical protein
LWERGRGGGGRYDGGMMEVEGGGGKEGMAELRCDVVRDGVEKVVGNLADEKAEGKLELEFGMG